MRIKLNENENSGMLYAIAYCEDPDIYSEEFWGWDTESDVGYELMEFGSLIQDADVFDSLEAAEDRADDVLSSIFEDEVFIVGLDPYTPHNLTGFVKKIIRDSIKESKSIKEDINDPDEILTFKRNIEAAEDLIDIENLIWSLSDGVAEDAVQRAFDENEDAEDLQTVKDAIIRELDIYLEDNEWLGESKSIKESSYKKGDRVELDNGMTGTVTKDFDWENEDQVSVEIDGTGEMRYPRSETLKDLDESKSINDNSNNTFAVRFNTKNGAILKSYTQTFDNYKDALKYAKDNDTDLAWAIDKNGECIVTGGYGSRIKYHTDWRPRIKTESNRTLISSIARDYVEVAYICDGFTNFRVFGGGFKTSDALVAVEDEKGKRLRLTMGDVCEFYTWYDAKGNVIHEPTYYSED